MNLPFCLFLSAIIFLSVFSQSASAWQEDYSAWQYRKAVAINGSTSTLMDYQVPINITTALYNNTGLVGSWHFTANSTEDSSGNGNHGTQYGGVNCSATGRVGGGCSFDGSDDYVDLPDNSVFGTVPATYGAWIKMDNLPASSEGMIISSDDGISSGIQLAAQSTGKVRWLWIGDSDYFDMSSDTTLSVGVWYHVVGVVTVDNAQIYINGILDKQTAISPGSASATNMAIGYFQRSSDYFFNGTIDEVRIYNRALSAQEITDQYNAGKARLDLQDLRFVQSYTVYELPINISGADLADYQVLINITNTTILSHMRTDGGDIRFFNYSTSTPYSNQTLPFWIENITSAQALIWLKANVSASGSMFYMYYGNPSATYNNSLGGNNTFNFFDDFDDGTLDTSKWTTTGGAGSYSEANGLLTMTNSKYIGTSTTYTGGYAFRTRAVRGSDTTGVSWSGFASSADALANVNFTLAWYYDSSTNFNFNSGDGTNYQVITEKAIDGSYHTVEARRTGTADRFQMDSGTEKTGNYPTNSARVVTIYAYSADAIFDWIAVRKYASPEPTATLGTETIKSASNEVPLNHWLESDNQAWIKMNMTTGNNTVHMYYGNPSATYNNSLGGNNTFVFFDDFEDSDISDWTGDISSYTTESNTGSIRLKKTSDSGSGTYKILGKSMLSVSDYEARIDAAHISTDQRWFGFGQGDNALNTYQDFRLELKSVGDLAYWTTPETGNTISFTVGTTWHTLKILKLGKNTKFYADTTLVQDRTDTNLNYVNTSSIEGEAIHYFDNYRVRKYASPEPSVLSVGAEETRPVLWLKTYDSGGKAQSFFAINETVKIKAKTEGATKLITITDPSGSIAVNGASMANETVPYGAAVWNYSFNSIWQAGWYDVRISGIDYKKAFYVGSTWQNNWTDAQGRNFSFRMQMNLSEPNVLERFFEPTDLNLNFAYKAHPNSIRVTAWNGSQLIDIPSQGYNFTYQDGYAVSGNVVFLATSNKSENATYYIYYSRSNESAGYATDLGITNTSEFYEIQNNEYKIGMNRTKGGVIQDARNKRGSNENLAGYNPMQMSPEAMGGSQYIASSLAAPSISIANGSLFANYKTSGEIGNMRFNLTYASYSHAPYIILETNVSPLSGETWDYYYDQQFRLKDGYFSKSTWRNSTGAFEYAVGSGNGADMTGLGELDWIAAYNNASGNSIGTIFLANSQSQAVSINSEFYDDGSYERYRRRQFSAGSASVSPSDYFYSKTAIVLWNAFDNYERLNETYYRLKNPLGANIGASETYDTQSPINTTSGYTPQSPKDNESVTCYSYWTDNLELDYAIVTINSSAHNNQSTVFIRANESWVNYTISAGSLEAGTVTCNITVYDTAKLGNSTLTSFSVSDTIPPYFTSIKNQPNTTLALDPGVQVNITANLTEYATVDSAILEYRDDTQGSWQSSIMNRTWNNTYNYTYSANFTPDTNGTWQYRIFANDTFGNSNYSEIINLSITYEVVWQHSPQDFGSVSGKLGSNISVGNLVVDNTADIPLSFKITSDWATENEMFFNGTAEGDTGFIFNLNNGESATIPVNVTAETNARSIPLIITIDALNASAQPDSNTTTATIVSYASGPFLLVTITDYDASVTQGDTGVMLKAKVQNLGNETATNTWLAFQLPGDWTVTSGSLNKTIGSIPKTEIRYNEINVSISSSAATGSQAIYAIARSSENTTGTDDQETVTVNEKATQTPSDSTPPPGGGGSISGGAGITPEQKEKLLQTEETYELVRGQEQKFTLMVENRFDGALENVSVRVSGYLAQYLRIEPAFAQNIPQNSSFRFTIYIEAPKYFTRGEHILDFLIKGSIRRSRLVGNSTSVSSVDLKEKRKVVLAIHEVSRQSALEYMDKTAGFIDDMKKAGVNTGDVLALFSQMNESLGRKDYEAVKAIYESVKTEKEKVSSTLSLMEELRGKIREAEHNGIEVSGTARLLLLAGAALDRQDYETALKRAEDARVTYAMETVGKINPLAYIRNEWPMLTVASIIAAFLAWMGSRSIRLGLINRRLGILKEEEAILLGLVKEIQKECFEQGKLSMEDYMDGLMQYEKRLGKIVQEIIELQTKRGNILKVFGKEEQRLMEERKRLVGLMEETQRQYIEGGKFETRIYKNRMNAYIEKLSEVEEKLATIEANTALKRGR